MTAFSNGSILSYHYLWARQADAGEESGRKARPVCLAVTSPSDASLVYLFPITSQKPTDAPAGLAITEIECRRGGLRHPSWLILDEYNQVDLADAYDLAATAPLGRFSAAFTKAIATRIRDLAARHRVRGVRRR